MRSILDKKGAFEMSMTTVVIIVLAILMLILGTTLVTKIFSGATDVAQLTNEQVKEQLKKLYADEEQKIVVYLPKSNIAQIKQGELSQVAVGIKNLDVAQKTVTSKVTLGELGKCPSSTDPMGWITTGKESTFNIPSGDIAIQRINIQPPRTTPLCAPRFKVTVYEGNQVYAETDFDIEIKAK